MTNQRRYPGTRAFEPGEQHLFFGRAEETDRLLAQVKAQSLVVVFSKSGIGKSSLVNAGLRPLLGIEGYHPIPVRVQDTGISPVDATKAGIEAFLDTEKLKQHANASKEEAGLWECMRACKFTRYGMPVIPVLIFDQFEEFFEHAQSARQEWATELGDLIGQRLPNRIKEQIRSTPPEERSASFDEWCKPIPIRVICAIRSDRLSLIDYLKDEIPGILNTSGRFHLKPLNRAQAKEAIVLPAALEGSEFDCPKFKYEDATIEMILDELVDQKTGSEVESFQLQLVCQYLEDQISEGKIQLDGKPMTPAAFGGRAGIQNILKNYYENTLEQLSKLDRKRAKIFIEDGLIYRERRIGIAAGLEEDNFGVDSKLLTFLLEKRLVRAVNNSFGKSYEVSHDAFLKPMLESKQKRLEKQAMEQLARERAERERMLEEQAMALREQQARYEEERQLKEEAYVARQEAEDSSRRAKMFSYISLAITLITLAFGIYAWRMKCESHELSGQFFQETELYDKALEEFNNARNWGLFPSTRLDSVIDYAQVRKVKYGKHNLYMTDADSLAKLGAAYLDKAKMFYKQAHDLGYEPDETSKAIESLDKVIQSQLYEYKDKARAFLDAGGWEEAIYALTIARKLDSTDYEVKRLMERAKALKEKDLNRRDDNSD